MAGRHTADWYDTEESDTTAIIITTTRNCTC